MAPDQDSLHNILVRNFDSETFASLRTDFERVEIGQGEEVVVPGVAPEFVYFPEGGVFSILAVPEGGELATEVALFGHEGVSAISTLLGAGNSPLKTITQIDGHKALRIETELLMRTMARDPALKALILVYAHVSMVQLASSAIAYSQHPLEVRLARWLLMCGDRVESTKFHITHEFMSTMLGAHRSSVTVTLHTLEGIGAIRAMRGTVAIQDRGKLLELAGKSYGLAESEYCRLIDNFGMGTQPPPG